MAKRGPVLPFGPWITLMKPEHYLRIIIILVVLQGCFCIRGIVKNGVFQFPQKEYEVGMLTGQWEHKLNKGGIIFSTKKDDAAIAIYAEELTSEDREKSVEAFATMAAIVLKESHLIDEVKAREIQVNGRQAIENLYSGISKGKDVILKGEKYRYLLRYIATPLTFDKNLPDFEKGVESFHIVEDHQ